MISFAMQLSVEFVNNLVAKLNVLASQVATALDTLNFALVTERNQQSDTRVPPRAPRNSRHGLRPRIITATRIRTRLWIPPPPGIYRPYPRLGRHIEMPRTAFLVAVQSQCWIGCHRQGLAPLPPHSGREPGQTSPTTPDSDSDGPGGLNHLSEMAQTTCTGLGTAALFLSRSHMRPSIHGSIVTGSPEDINGSAIRTPALHVQFSLRDHQTSCTLD